MAASACMGTRSRARPGASVSSNSSMTFERNSGTRGSRLRVTPAACSVWHTRSMNSSNRIAGLCRLRTRTISPERFLNVCSAPTGTEADPPGASVRHSPSTTTSKDPSRTS